MTTARVLALPTLLSIRIALDKQEQGGCDFIEFGSSIGPRFSNQDGSIEGS